MPEEAQHMDPERVALLQWPMAAEAEKTDDLELLADLLAAKPGAWRPFYDRFERLIAGCIRRVCGRYAHRPAAEDIEDLINTVCLQMLNNDYRKLRQFDPLKGYRLSSWVGLISTNVAHDALRRRGPTVQPMDALEAAGFEPVDPGPSPAETTLRRQRVTLLERALEQLAPAERSFVEYYYARGLSAHDVADLMGTTINTVYSRKNKVRSKLQRIIASQGSFDPGVEEESDEHPVSPPEGFEAK